MYSEHYDTKSTEEQAVHPSVQVTKVCLCQSNVASPSIVEHEDAAKRRPIPDQLDLSSAMRIGLPPPYSSCHSGH